MVFISAGARALKEHSQATHTYDVYTSSSGRGHGPSCAHRLESVGTPMQPRNTPLPWVPPAVYHHRTRDCHRLLRAGLRQPSATPWSRLQEQSACGEGAVRSWHREWREARLNHRMSVYTASRGGSALSRGSGMRRVAAQAQRPRERGMGEVLRLEACALGG